MGGRHRGACRDQVAKLDRPASPPEARAPGERQNKAGAQRPMSSEQKNAVEPLKRTLRKRSRKPTKHEPGDNDIRSKKEEIDFRIWFLAKETGISSDQARDIIRGPAKDGASLLSAARSLRAPSGDQ